MTFLCNNMINLVDDLPPELLHLIMYYLDLKDLFSCRLVNKKWNSIVKNFKISEIFFFYLKRVKDNWFFINQPIDQKILIDHSKLFCLKTQLFNFRNLKKLKIFRLRDEVNLMEINQLKNLEHLELMLVYLKVDDYNSELNLPKLSHLCLTSIGLERSIEINTPKLSHLFLGWYTMNSLKFKYPETIKYFYFNSNYDDDILQFKNLILLQCTFPTNINPNILTSLTNLKVLRTTDEHPTGLIVFNKIIEEKLKLRKDVDIFYQGIKMSTCKEINELKFGNFNNFTNDHDRLLFLLKNYNLLCNNLYWIRIVDYIEIINILKSIPADFKMKFINIRELEARNKINNQNEFIQFLKQCKNLHRLILNFTELEGEFYEKIPEFSNQLIYLNIVENSIKNIDFNFLSKIEYLEHLYSNQNVNLINLNLNQLNYLKEFIFKIKNNFIDIYKSSKDEFSFKCSNGFEKNKLNFNDLINWFNYLNEDLNTENKLKKLRSEY